MPAQLAHSSRREPCGKARARVAYDVVEALSLLPLVLAGLAACGGASHTEPPPSACHGDLASITRPASIVWTELPVESVGEVRIRGARTVPEALVRERISLPVGQPIDPAVVRGDVRQLLSLAVLDDVRVHADRERGTLVVTYELIERPLVRRVHVRGVGDGVSAHRVERVAGEVFVPQRMQRLGERLAAAHREEGYTDAVANVRATRAPDGRVDMCFEVDAGARWLIEAIEFEGNSALDDDALADLVSTYGGRVNVPGGVYRDDLLADDMPAMLAAYYDRGHITANIAEPRIDRHDGLFTITIPVEEGPEFRLGALTVSGELALEPAEYLRLLGLREGEIFSRSRVAEGMERVRARESARSIDIVPATNLDLERHIVDLDFEVNVIEEIVLSPEAP